MAIAKSPLLYRCYLLITMLYLAFIGVASFYLTGAIPDTSSVLDAIFATTAWSLRLNFHNLRDIATNVVLYLPLGILVCATGSVKKTMAPFGLILLLGLAVSVFVEVTQAFIGRFSDLVDIISNSSGYALGYWIGWWAIHRIGLRPAILLGHAGNQTQRTNTLLGLRFGYVMVALIVSLLPLNVSVVPSELMAQFSNIGSLGVPRLILDPLYHFRAESQNPHVLILRLLVVIPFAVLSALLDSGQRYPVAIRVAQQCLVFSATLELCKVFVLGAYSDIFVVIIAPIIGLLVALAIHTSAKETNDTSQTGYWPFALLAYALFLTVMAWSPFQFELGGRIVIDKLADSNLIPFRLHFSTRSMASALDIVKESVLYIPLGVFGYQWLRSATRLSKWSIATLVLIFGCGFAAILELSQLIVVGRYVDITDPLLAALGCLIGWLLTPMLAKIIADRKIGSPNNRPLR